MLLLEALETLLFDLDITSLIRLLIQNFFIFFWPCLGFYLFYRLVIFVKFVYLCNWQLRDVPVNPGIPLKFFGYFQNLGAYKRHEMIKKLMVAEQEMRRNSAELKNKKIPDGLTKVYRLPFLPNLVINSTNACDKIFESTKFIDKTNNMQRVFNNILGPSIITDKQNEWRVKRRILMKAMHNDLIKDYSSINNQYTAKMVNEIKKDNGQSRKIYFEDYEYNLNLRILAKNIFGQDLNVNDETSKKFIEIWWKTAEILELRLSKPLLSLQFIWKIYKFVKKIEVDKLKQDFTEVVGQMLKIRDDINRKSQQTNAESADTSSPKKLLIADKLLDFHQSNQLTYQQMINEAKIFFCAALDTTSISISAAIYALSHPKNRKVLEKLSNEVEHYFPNTDLQKFETNMINYDPNNLQKILDQMEYLDAVIKETLRLYGPAPVIGRKIIDRINFGTEDDPFFINGSLENPVAVTLFSGFISAKDRNFEPERFLINQHHQQEEQDSISIHRKEINLNSAEFSPFSRGLRNCLGKKMALSSMKIQLIHLVKNFDLKLVFESEHDKMVDRPCVMSMMYKFEKKPLIEFLKRK